MTSELKNRFATALNILSPENLICEGMLSPSKVRRRLRAINAERRRLEKRASRKVIKKEVNCQNCGMWWDSEPFSQDFLNRAQFANFEEARELQCA